MYPIFYWLPLVAALLLVEPALAQSDKDILKTDWIEQTRGYHEQSVGAQVRRIESEGAEDQRKITVSIPKTSIKHPEFIEEVVVVGKKPGESEPLLDARIEWLDDYDNDNDNYGLVIHLGKNSNWLFTPRFEAIDGIGAASRAQVALTTDYMSANNKQ
jgi:hypothetical protein